MTIGAEMDIAVVPPGSHYLAKHLMDLYDDVTPFRVDDYHLGMAVAILLDPERHLIALAEAGMLVPTKKGWRVRKF